MSLSQTQSKKMMITMPLEAHEAYLAKVAQLEQDNRTLTNRVLNAEFNYFVEAQRRADVKCEQLIDRGHKLIQENERMKTALEQIADDHFVAEYMSELRKLKKIAKEALGLKQDKL